MGVKIGNILEPKEVKIKDLSGKIIVIDASLFLYQFITTIRQPDGKPLMDSKGNVTSHLSGLFSRTVNLMQKGLKLAYVFDGKSPELKERERARRQAIKEKAETEYMMAVREGDVDNMRKFASRTAKLTPEMIIEAKELIQALGLPIIEAPSEAEAQGAYMVAKGDSYAIATQDSDVFMFGATRLVRNLSLLGKRKKTKTLAYTSIKPEIVTLSETLNSLGIDQDQFIVMCMLIGTDFNIGGIKGLGPKKALAQVKEYGKDFDRLFEDVKWDEAFDFPWTEVYYLIKKIPVTDEYNLSWSDINSEKIFDLLVKKHEFVPDRIENSLSKLIKETKIKDQKSLFDF